MHADPHMPASSSRGCLAGAAAAGIDSLFVAGGIHAQELGTSRAAPAVDQGALRRLCNSHGAAPQFVIPYLQ